jgi:hypothetical protein
VYVTEEVGRSQSGRRKEEAKEGVSETGEGQKGVEEVRMGRQCGGVWHTRRLFFVVVSNKYSKAWRVRSFYKLCEVVAKEKL